MQLHKLSLQEVKEMDMVDYLNSLGYHPQRFWGNDYWYLSPLHEEHTPSFKVNRQLNCWYDHSLGKGGNLIDFGVLFHHCSVKEVLKKINTSLSFHQPKKTALYSPNDDKNIVGSATKMAEQEGIKITCEKPITSPFLLSYLRSRNIPFSIAQKHLKEVHYELHNKPYYALGFRNDSGGYELRNKYFKGSSSPKDVTTILNGNSKEKISVFEGFFSFLSYLAIQEKNGLALTNFLVLNSLSLFHKNIEKMEQCPKVHLYLDNDTMGNEVTARAIQRSEKFTDERGLYKGFKDCNQWLIHQNQKPQQSHRLYW